MSKSISSAIKDLYNKIIQDKEDIDRRIRSLSKSLKREGFTRWEVMNELFKLCKEKGLNTKENKDLYDNLRLLNDYYYINDIVTEVFEDR